ncbi:MAG: hypothetical protein H6821_05525 [Planctomycetaceae bacterium]|nr:hypothetical protein [Planctomycetaceae bacterium]MCB9940172.1 hypothetical protein [Planctomycetaceae bacterium]
MAKDKHSRDQKRKKKLEERKRKARPTESLAYMGEKYKTKELVHTLMHTEIGIYETYVMTDRKLVDQTVVSAVETLIRQIRTGTLPPYEDTSELHYDADQEYEFVIENIRRNWASHFANEWKPPRDKLIGVLRTILGSIEKLRSPGPRSQSYMRHIEGFLTKKLGVSVKAYSQNMEPLPEPPVDELLTLGRQWIEDESQQTAVEFQELVDYLLKKGAADRVLHCCHQLIGEESDPDSEVVAELTGLCQQARTSLVTSMG